MRAEKWRDAVKRAEAFISKSGIASGAGETAEVSIYTWADHDPPRLRSIGLRVAEVSFWWAAPDSTKEAPLGSGSSFMQGDLPWGAAVCLLTERLIIAYAEDWPADEIMEEEQRLVYALAVRLAV